MNLGLKRGTVKLFPHEKEWETEAQNTIYKLSEILGSVLVDISHVGSTSIKSIKAKPIIDIVVAVNNFQDILRYVNALKKEGFYYRPNVDISNQLLFACGSFYNGTGDLQTHFIHIVLADSIEWNNYLLFRNYLNSNPNIAKEYERVKTDLYVKFPNDRSSYLKGKKEIINSILEKASE